MAVQKVITASTLIKTGQGKLKGFIIPSSTAGTIKAWDSLTASGTIIMDTSASIVAPTTLTVPGNEVDFTTGLFVTIGGTASVTVVYE